MRGGQNLIDLTGQLFGRLTVLRMASRPEDSRVFWECKCSCGMRRVIRGYTLRSGRSLSCGCLRTEVVIKRNTKHGLTRNKYYPTWRDMMHRCYNENNENYVHYGARGIAVCDEWKNVESFIEWCKAREPIPRSYTIDRYPDNNGDYSPANCRFSSKSQQNRNTRRTFFVYLNGEKISFIDLVERNKSVTYEVARGRLRRGWDPIRAASEAVK